MHNSAHWDLYLHLITNYVGKMNSIHSKPHKTILFFLAKKDNYARIYISLVLPSSPMHPCIIS